MKTNIICTIVILLWIQMTSCTKDFLDVPDKRVIVRQSYITDLTTTSTFLNGIYIDLASRCYSGSSVIYPDLISDNIIPTTGSEQLLNFYRWEQQANDEQAEGISPSALNTNGLWLSGYRVARNCAFVLETIDQYRSENPTKADDLKGQAYAIRGLVQHLLVNFYAQPYAFTATASHLGIPYAKTSKYNEEINRQSVKDVYQNIISDLTSGIALMADKPTNVKDVNRFEVMNKDAAKAILARVYLYIGDYKNANTLALEVSEKYPMMTGSNYPSKLYTGSDTESLLRLTPSNSASGYYTLFSGINFRSSKVFSATNDIGELLFSTTSDSRSNWVSAVLNTQGQTEYEIHKFPMSVTSTHDFADADYYQTIIRSTEMFITAAESFYMLGDETNARLYLNKVMQRANPLAPAISLSGTPLLESIFDERRKEFCFEGLRMFDLLRWKKGVHRKKPLTTDKSDLPYPSGKAISPIPATDVKNGLTQNESY